MREGYFFSDEPGYYEPGVGGVRLETILRTKKLLSSELKYSNKDYGNFLGFEPVCLVPFEPKLINYSLLTEPQIDWLNNYNNMIQQKIGPMLKDAGKNRLENHFVVFSLVFYILPLFTNKRFMLDEMTK